MKKSMDNGFKGKLLVQSELRAVEGQSAQLASMLLQAAEVIRQAKGCQFYLVAQGSKDNNVIAITEVWDSYEAHENALTLPGVGDVFLQAMALIDGVPDKFQEFEIL